jgi:hypothetical protein
MPVTSVILALLACAAVCWLGRAVGRLYRRAAARSARERLAGLIEIVQAEPYSPIHVRAASGTATPEDIAYED